jgi:hypothetical protein
MLKDIPSAEDQGEQEAEFNYSTIHSKANLGSRQSRGKRQTCPVDDS